MDSEAGQPWWGRFGKCCKAKTRTANSVVKSSTKNWHSLLFFFLLRFTLPACSQSIVTNVLYGERDTNRTTMAVFFDKNGDAYPDYFIADTALQASNGSLSDWYAKHPMAFREIAMKYRCAFQDYSPANVQTVNDSIRAGIAARINNERARYGSVTIMVHGFRKPFRDTLEEYTSPDDYQMLESTLSGFGLQTLYVEVYWDGLYGCCFGLNLCRNNVLFRMFETAQQQAANVARQVRRLLTAVQFDTVNLISHSLGAKILTEALFNVSAGAIEPTPLNKRINICLIAPAIAGTDVFQHYYKRNPVPETHAPDNYHLAIVYNKKDFVLRKKDNKVGWFGPGPYKYGNTTLGCNCDGAATKLQAYFQTNFPNSTISLFNRSNIGKCHYLGKCYCDKDNLRELVAFMRN